MTRAEIKLGDQRIISEAGGRALVPDLAFGEHIQMGENIFFFMGEMQECYVIYWLDAPVVAE